MSIRSACVTLLAAALVTAAPAFAGTPGKWTQLGEENLANIDQVALARTADGTLHAIWTIPGTSNDTLVHDAIGPNGVVAPPNVVETGWAAIAPVPDIVADSSGLRAIFGGIRSIDPNETNSNLNTATAPASGAAWGLQVGSVVTDDSAYASDVGAALLQDGTPIESWGSTGAGVFVHRGLDPATPNFPLQGQLGSCCGYSPDIAVDTANGIPVVAWVSNATDKEGVWTQTLDPATAAPEGSPAKMPGSTTLFDGHEETSQQLQRIGIAARAGGGVYVAYPSGYPTTKKVIVWRVGATSPITVASSDLDHITSVAADPAGHIWVVWAERGASNQVFARRSNKAGTKFGPAVKAGHPAKHTSIYKIDANAQAGALDVIGLFGGVTSQNAQYDTQILPGLALSAKPAKLKKGKKTTITFTVSDPDPVQGATVTLGGKSEKTDKKGHATITVTSKKHLTAIAKKAGYTNGTKRV